MNLIPFLKYLYISAFFNLQVINIKEVKIEYVDRSIETPFKISCKYFEEAFRRQYRIKKIKSKVFLYHFQKHFYGSIKTLAKENIDVRIKVIVLFKNMKKRVLCIDAFDDISIDGLMIKENKKLLDLIVEQIKTE